MKKRIIVPLLLLLNFVSFAQSVYDVNRDGSINTADVVAIYNYIIVGGETNPNPFPAKITFEADVTNVANTHATINVSCQGASDVSFTSSGGLIYNTKGNPSKDNSTLLRGSDTGGSFNLTGLNQNTKYYCRYCLILDGEFYYSDVFDFQTLNLITKASGEENGVQYVDLGLPSKRKWAFYNMGASQAYEVGSLFAYGETTTKESFTKDNWLNTNDDAAFEAYGGDWHIPLSYEWKELVSNCTIVDDIINSVEGYYFIGPNGNCLFMPKQRYRVKCLPTDGHSWTISTFYPPMGLQYHNPTDYNGQDRFLYEGYPIRACGASSTTVLDFISADSPYFDYACSYSLSMASTEGVKHIVTEDNKNLNVKGEVSDNDYIEFVPSSSAANPSVVYWLNTKPGLYDISVIFVPENFIDTYNKNPKCNKVSTQLLNVNNNDTIPLLEFKTDVTKVDTITIGQNIIIKRGAYIRINSNISLNDRKECTPNMSIDGIILRKKD